ncbi:MAG: hypothetical protein OXC08_11810 [Thiotrichales bacterium]|nr:hypothetical protein [Thiotrichales bacterium]
MFGLEPETMYRPNDPAMAIVGAPQTLANQRQRGDGPAYYRHGGRVLYRGQDVIDWLKSKRVEPAAA